MKIVYLHGFASSPQSRKAGFFASALRSRGCAVDIPELDGGDFRTLTVTRQLRIAGELIAGEPTLVMGSSLGGYLAALLAARHTQIERLILLAPAFDFVRLWHRELGPERIAEWKRTGSLPVFHYGSGRTRELSYSFMADAERYEPFPDVRQPALICHGDRDSVVPLSVSERFSSTHANAQLAVFPSGHELTDVMDDMWEKIGAFLELT